MFSEKKRKEISALERHLFWHIIILVQVLINAAYSPLKRKLKVLFCKASSRLTSFRLQICDTLSFTSSFLSPFSLYKLSSVMKISRFSSGLIYSVMSKPTGVVFPPWNLPTQVLRFPDLNNNCSLCNRCKYITPYLHTMIKNLS